MAERGIQIYPGSGKKPWDRAENEYPPRSHDCMPCETEFAESFEETQIDLERREKNQNKKRTMQMWKNALDHTWATRPLQATRKIIDRQRKIMRDIIEREGGRTAHWAKSIGYTEDNMSFTNANINANSTQNWFLRIMRNTTEINTFWKWPNIFHVAGVGRYCPKCP